MLRFPMRKSGLLLLLLTLIVVPSRAQNKFQPKIDSLLALIKRLPNDTSRITPLLNLADQYRQSDLNKADAPINDALTLVQNNDHKKGLANGFRLKGLVLYSKGEFEQARKNYLKALNYSTEINDRNGILLSIFNLGVVSVYLGDYTAANTNFFKALKLSDELGDKKSIGDCYAGIANVYGRQGNSKLELSYHLKALHLKEETNDNYGIAASYINIGNVYGRRMVWDTALTWYFKGLDLAEKIENQRWVLNSLGNIGTVYTQQKKYKEGLEYLLRCYHIAEKIGDKQSMITTLNTLGGCYWDMGDKKQGLDCLNKALNMAIEIGSKNEIRQSYESLSDNYADMGDYKNAYLFHRRSSDMKDSILNEESSKQINEMQAKYDSDKKEQEITLLNKDKEIQTAQVNHQRFIILVGAIGLFIVLLMAFFIFRQYLQKQKANSALETAYHQIEEKNKDITDSINYAQKIQTAILPSIAHMQQHLPELFVFYKPKDIVSGDFYWFSEKNGQLFLTAADCTGHGVPGGFMSMLGISLLNELINEKEITEPADVLDLMRIKLIQSLKQRGESGENKDGMDMVLCRMDRKKNKLSYAAANNPLWMVRNNELISFSADKQPVGIYGQGSNQFTQHEIDVLPKDMIYLFSDGFADQFGGEQGKKFMSKNLKQLFLAVSNDSCEVQRRLIEQHFIDWKGSREQIDDVLVIGFRI